MDTGQFEKRRVEDWAPGERAPVVKRQDNLRPEGDFTKKAPEEWTPGQRAQAVKYDDNLSLLGFEEMAPLFGFESKCARQSILTLHTQRTLLF